ncbi:Bug family tripartite tricarboxylate transporter substrate binding protein [Advenella mimigardefordensis]|nr:tripartite tricarboxylate transporter substrate binding protein [Advenella mimigardefordensis]
MIARRLGESVSRQLGQPIVVENRPGAQGVVASRALTKAANDGYTLLLGTNSTHAASIYLFSKPGYDPVKDFTPIMRFTTNPLVLCVRADSNIDSLKAFIEHGKTHSGQMNYGAGNTGSLVATHLLTTQAGFDAQAVNYAGNAVAVNDFLAGRLDFMVTDPMIIKQFVESGQVRMLGLTSRKKLPLFPELAPIADLGLPDYEYASWIGLFGPAQLPADITQKLYAAFSDALASQEAQQYLNSIGMIAADLPPATFGDFVKDQIQVWGHLTSAAGLVAQ